MLLLDHDRALAQFAGLVRRTLPTGREQVNHDINGHDDCSNAIALAACIASVEEQKIPFVVPIIFGGRNPTPTPGLSTTEAFYGYYNNGGGGKFWEPI